MEGLWSAADTHATAYPVYIECPAAPSTPIPASPDNPDKVEAVRTALIKAFRFFIYGQDPWGRTKEVSVPDMDIQKGRIVLKRSGALSLIYAITESTVVDADVLQDTGLPLARITDCSELRDANPAYNAVTRCLPPDESASACPTNSYPISIIPNPNLATEQATTFKVCGLCQAGTYGRTGYGCTACPAGQSSTVGGSCSHCPAGTFAPAGTSQCFPCPKGTYASREGTATCKECPEDSHTWIPGAKACLRCVKGVPQQCIGGVCRGPPSSPGQMVVSLAKMASCMLTSDIGYEFKTWSKCQSWRDDRPVLQLAFDIGGDCSIQISPITDPSCADPTDPRTAPNSPTYDPAVHPYGAVQMRAYYKSPTQIRTLLDTASGVTNSVMFNIDPSGSNSLQMSLYAATTDPIEAETPFVRTYPGVPSISPAFCNTTLLVTGGEIVGARDTNTHCPPGTYADEHLYCPKCPVGFTCSKERITPCPTNTFNHIIGLGGPCFACPADGAFTTYAGAMQCDVVRKPLEVKCDSDQRLSLQYDRASQSCQRCPAGTWRDYSETSKYACKHCPKGYYSRSGDASCTACPIGQIGPLEGFGDLTLITGNNCVVCPRGSMALVGGGRASVSSVPCLGSTVCSPCPPGTFLPAADQACQLCPSDTYRTGNAAPENNVCKPIPAGYRLGDDSHVHIELCPPGQVSFLDSQGRRVPYHNPKACVSCAGLDTELGLTGGARQWAHTYAPRKGMSQCVACPAGQVPLSYGDLTPACQACPNGTFRREATVSATCQRCGAGREPAWLLHDPPAGLPDHNRCQQLRALLRQPDPPHPGRHLLQALPRRHADDERRQRGVHAVPIRVLQPQRRLQLRPRQAWPVCQRSWCYQVHSLRPRHLHL